MGVQGVTWVRKRGDNWPPRGIQLADNDATLVPLTNLNQVTVVWYRTESSEEVLTQIATVQSVTESRIQIPTDEALTATAGLYAAEIVVSYTTGGERRIPNSVASDYLYLLVRTDRAAPAFPAAPFTTLTGVAAGGSIQEVGEGNTLPADGSTFELFRLSNSPLGLPNGLYMWDEQAGVWVQS